MKDHAQEKDGMENTGGSCAGGVNPIVSLAPESTLAETKGVETQHLQTEQPIPIPDIVIRNDDVYPLVLACFFRFAGPFFAYVMQSTNNYHHQCMKDGVTPVRRLQMWP